MTVPEKQSDRAADVVPQRRRPLRIRRWLLLAVAAVALWIPVRSYFLPSLFHGLARSAITRHSESSALEWLDWADLPGTDHPTTALLRMQANRRLGKAADFDAAREDAKRRGAPADRISREEILLDAQSGRLRGAEPHLARLLQDYQGDNKDVCQAYVAGYLLNQRIPDALRLLDAWMSDAPDDGYPWWIRARIRRLTTDTAREEADLKEAIRRSPGLTGAHVELAELLQDNHRSEEAIALFRPIQSDPEFGARATVGLATCLKSLGRQSECQELLRGVAESHPDDFLAAVEFGRCLIESGTYQDAERVLRRAAELRPTDDTARYLLAQSLQMEGREAEAQQHFEFVAKAREAQGELFILKDQIQSDPKNDALYVKTGKLLLLYGDPEEGLITLHAALDVNPRCTAAHQALADYYAAHAADDPTMQQRADWHRAQCAGQPAE